MKTACILLFAVAYGGEARGQPDGKPSLVYPARLGMTIEEVLELIPPEEYVVARATRPFLTSFLLREHHAPSREKMQMEELALLLPRKREDGPWASFQFNHYNRLLRYMDSARGFLLAKSPEPALGLGEDRPEAYALGMSPGEVIELTPGRFDVGCACWGCGDRDHPLPTLQEMRRHRSGFIHVQETDTFLYFNHYGQVICISRRPLFPRRGDRVPTWVYFAGAAALAATVGAWLVVRRREARVRAAQGTAGDGNGEPPERDSA